MTTNPESKNRLTKTEVEASLNGLSPADWQRSKNIAHSFCFGLTDWTPEDLLQETLLSLLNESRIWHPGLHPLVVIKSAMHSIASNARKHNKLSPIDQYVVVDPLEAEEGDKTPAALGNVTFTPEDELSGKQQMKALYKELQGDKELEDLATAWACGIRGADACKELGWDAKKHDAVRNRLQRRLNAFAPDRRPK